MRQTHTSPVNSYPIHITANENMPSLVHWFRKQLFDECPECHGTHSKRVVGWAKRECDECGCVWNYGL
jgi:hypothetical protein